MRDCSVTGWGLTVLSCGPRLLASWLLARLTGDSGPGLPGGPRGESELILASIVQLLSNIV